MSSELTNPAVLNTAESLAEESVTPEMTTGRSVRLVRVIAMLVSGLAITFTATMHERLAFDITLAGIMIAWIGVAHLIEWFALRSKTPNVVPLLLAIASGAAAVTLLFLQTPIGFGVTIAAWALVCALLEFVNAVIRPGSRQDAYLVGAAGVLLALLALVFREDQVAVVGLLGAYGILLGVFLGISAFDSRRGSRPTGSDPSPASAAETTVS